uniref:Uncharacterized protein n=1 Tax=Rhizophora mucronata TaxID=61149 RepID=A0A2P2NEE1_RHIMU
MQQHTKNSRPEISHRKLLEKMLLKLRFKFRQIWGNRE